MKLRGKLYSYAMAALVIVATFSGLHQATGQETGRYRIVGYAMGSRGKDLSTIQANRLTHINYAFASVIDGEIAFRFRTPQHEANTKKNLALLRELKKVNPNLKLMVSVGGWANCAGFSDAALTPESRAKFAKSGVKIMNEYGFDGVDLDWEYPGQVGGGEKYRPEDKENFTLMLKALREEFDRTGSHHLLTIATGADEEYFRWTELGKAQQYLDFINVMTYDFYSGLSTISGHHSNLGSTKFPGATAISTEIAVDRHLRAGVPAEKIVVGVPFYGRFWKGVPATANGMYQQAQTTGNYKNFNEISGKYLTNPSFRRYWDQDAQAPYLYSADSAMVISYDDPESLMLKTKYVKKNHLGGIMFWEYFGDNNGQLLETLYQNLKP